MTFFTDAELADLRDLSTDAMDVTGRLTDNPTTTWDSNTGRNAYSEGTTRWTGDFALRPARPSRQPVAGEEELFYRQATVHLPHTAPQPRIDDRLVITACARNSELVGEVFRVMGVEFDSDLVSWTLTVEHRAGSRTEPE